MHNRSSVFQWFRALLAPTTSPQDRREAPTRAPLSISVQCFHQGRPFEARIQDFSAQGLCISCAQRLEIEDTIEVASLDGRKQFVSGRVAWISGKGSDVQLGIQFNPSDQNRLEHWLSLAQASQTG